MGDGTWRVFQARGRLPRLTSDFAHFAAGVDFFPISNQAGVTIDKGEHLDAVAGSRWSGWEGKKGRVWDWGVVCRNLEAHRKALAVFAEKEPAQQTTDHRLFSPSRLACCPEMLSRSVFTSSARSVKNAPVGARFASNLPIPPKVATPKSVQGPGGDSSRMESVVSFYKSLPKGAAPAKSGGGLKAR